MKKQVFQKARWFALASVMMFASLFMTTTINAQATIANHQAAITQMVADLTVKQSTLTPSSAKYDIVQDAITFLNGANAGLTANPQFWTDQKIFDHDSILKTHDTFMYNYSTAELATFNSMFAAESASGVNTALIKKLQWVLDANAY